MCEGSHPNIQYRNRGCGEGGWPSEFCRELVVGIKSAAGFKPGTRPPLLTF